MVPVNENTKEVVIIQKYLQFSNDSVTYHKCVLSESGTIAISIPTSTRSIETLSLKVKFDDEEKDLGYFYKKGKTERAEFGVKILKT